MKSNKRRTMALERLWFFPLILLSVLCGAYIPCTAYLINYTAFSVRLYQVLPQILLFFAAFLALGIGIAQLIIHWQAIMAKLGDYRYAIYGIVLALTFTALIQNQYPNPALLVWSVIAGLFLKKWEHKYVYLIFGIVMTAACVAFINNKLPLITLVIWGVFAGILIDSSLPPLEIYSDILLGLSLAIIVQLFCSNTGLQELSNTQPQWDYQSRGALLSLHFWGLCFILPMVLRLIDRKILCRIKTTGSVVIIALLISWLCVNMATSGLVPIKVITKDDEFVLSSKDNTVVFLVDSLDTQYVEDYILAKDMRLETPDMNAAEPEEVEDSAEAVDSVAQIVGDTENETEEVKYVLDEETCHELLENFTYFDNVVSGGAPSQLSVPTLFTGNLFNSEYQSLDQYYEESYSGSSLFKDLKDNGYSVRIYSGLDTLQYANIDNIDNIRTDISFGEKSFEKMFLNMLKLTGYYALPYQMKSLSWVSSNDIAGNIKITTPDVQRYSINDPVFCLNYEQNGLSVQDDQNCFVVYHLYGARYPLKMNEEGVETKEPETSLGQQLAGVFRMIDEYIEAMKVEGIYDNSTIIIAGNNGALELGQNPAVFIKPRNASGSFTRISEPRTFKNLRASLVDGILPNVQQTYGYNMFEQPASKGMTLREHYAHKNLWSQLYAENGQTYRKFIITDEAHGIENIVKTVETEPYEYKLNQWISFCGDEDEVTPDFPVTGLSFNEGNYCWTSGQDITMGFAISKPQKKAIFEMQVDGTITGYQRVNVYVNEKLLYDEVLGGPATIHVEIPKKVAPDGVFNIVLKLPDAATPMELGINDDPRVLSLRVTGCAIYSQKGYAKHLEQMAN